KRVFLLFMPKPKLLDQVRNIIRLRHFSIRTEEAYIYWIKKFILFHNKSHPLDMGKVEIEAFLSHLAITENVSPSTQNVALSAIIFLYREVLKKDLGNIKDFERSKRPSKLPLVFTRDEINKVLERLTGQ